MNGLDTLAHTYGGVFSKELSVVVNYDGSVGGMFGIAGFEGSGGKPKWTAYVWSSGRSGPTTGVHYQFVEMKEKDGICYIFGQEVAGAYLEAFDMKTGKCQFRFCTCFWFDFPEKWNIK
jgi:hypothetical protein